MHINRQTRASIHKTGLIFITPFLNTSLLKAPVRTCLNEWRSHLPTVKGLRVLGGGWWGSVRCRSTSTKKHQLQRHTKHQDVVTIIYRWLSVIGDSRREVVPLSTVVPQGQTRHDEEQRRRMAVEHSKKKKRKLSVLLPMVNFRWYRTEFANCILL